MTLNGIVENTNEEYHGGPGVSRSALMKLRRTPYHYWYEYVSDEYVPPEHEEIINANSALGLGNAIHTMVLEPHKFEEEYIAFPDVKRTTKEGKALWAQYKAKSIETGRQIINNKAHQLCNKISEAVRNHDDAKILLEGAQYEKSMYWTDPDTGILCKSRPDIMHSTYIGDLKTTNNASYRAFQQDMVKHGYHIQAGMIRQAHIHLFNTLMDNFFYIVVEKEPPHAVAIYQLDSMALDEGEAQFKKLLMKLKYCQEKDRYRGYPLKTIELPMYAFEGEL